MNAAGHAVAVLSEAVFDAYLAGLREVCVSYLFAGSDGNYLAEALDAFDETFGIETILVEGGAAIKGAILKAGLVDQIRVLIHPAVDGLAGVQSIFDYHDEADERSGAGQALRHLQAKALTGGMVRLYYGFEEAAVPTKNSQACEASNAYEVALVDVYSSMVIFFGFPDAFLFSFAALASPVRVWSDSQSPSGNSVRPTIQRRKPGRWCFDSRTMPAIVTKSFGEGVGWSSGWVCQSPR
ncbi:hypothetical protein J2X36_003888 [Methylobacterium sp. BE186]|uniref:dihydrofolate reductase family protein n=1 Tax=Methylobacterium sp. BE186 TaxID=2817715 RepID=UPI002856E465|nr:dihydrofolate reductase family protein [Methylobacterium sp. BE186]MDR7039115.1 hypothetical protein [Methylobacterium sp. BE186]